MSLTTYVEKDGQRIDISGLEQHTEARCDGCGEYGDDATLTQTVLQVRFPNGLSHSVAVHSHVGHEVEALEHGTERLRKEASTWLAP